MDNPKEQAPQSETPRSGGDIYAILGSITEEIRAIPKGRTSKAHQGQYRSLDDVLNHVHALFAKYNVFVTTDVLEHSCEPRKMKNDKTFFFTVMKIKFRFYAEDGSYVESTNIGEAQDSLDKGTAVAYSMAQRYVLQTLFTIPTAKSNPKRATPPPPSSYAGGQGNAPAQSKGPAKDSMNKNVANLRADLRERLIKFSSDGSVELAKRQFLQGILESGQYADKHGEVHAIDDKSAMNILNRIENPDD